MKICILILSKNGTLLFQGQKARSPHIYFHFDKKSNCYRRLFDCVDILLHNGSAITHISCILSSLLWGYKLENGFF